MLGPKRGSEAFLFLVEFGAGESAGALGGSLLAMAAAAREVLVSVRARNWGCWSLRVRFQEEYWEESGEEKRGQRGGRDEGETYTRQRDSSWFLAKHCPRETALQQEIACLPYMVISSHITLSIICNCTDMLRNQLHYPARLLDLPPAATVSDAHNRHHKRATYSAISDTKRAFTMKGSWGNLSQSLVSRPSVRSKATYLPLPSTLA
jgi:hypothetical protein